MRVKGISLIRRQKLSEEKLSIFCKALATMRPNREWAGGLQFPATVVRELADDNGRLMCLFDDPAAKTDELPENDAHALAIATHNEITEEDIKEIRAKLIRAGEKIEPDL